MPDTSLNTISVDDVINTYRNYDLSLAIAFAGPIVNNAVLYFMSELTGLSVDTLLEMI